MRPRGLRTRVMYRLRALWRWMLVRWYGVTALVEELWAQHVIAEEPMCSCVIYPRRGEASWGQVAEFRVIRTNPAVPTSKMVDCYLQQIERLSGPFPKVTR